MIRKILVVAITILLQTNFASAECIPCDTNGVEQLANVEKYEFNQVSEFLCVIQKKCLTNRNFNKLISETLQKVICNSPNVFLMVVSIKKVEDETLLELMKTGFTAEQKEQCRRALEGAAFTTLKRKQFIESLLVK